MDDASHELNESAYVLLGQSPQQHSLEQALSSQLPKGFGQRVLAGQLHVN